MKHGDQDVHVVHGLHLEDSDDSHGRDCDLCCHLCHCLHKRKGNPANNPQGELDALYAVYHRQIISSRFLRRKNAGSIILMETATGPLSLKIQRTPASSS